MITENKQQTQNIHTLSDVNSKTWTKLVKLLDQSPDDEWEKIGQYFTNIFGPLEIKTIRDNCARQRKFPTESVLNKLKQNLVPIDRVYKCFNDLQLFEACNILKEAFPADVLYKRPTSEATTTINTKTSNLPATSLLINENTAHSKDTQNARSDQTQIVSNISYATMNSNNGSSAPTEYLASSELIYLYERILPVLQEDTNNNDSSNSNETLTNEFEVNLTLNGNFTHTEIMDRKLTFKKREFKKVFDYLRELKMVKHVHLNLCVPVGILKSFDGQALSLLYPAETRDTKLLCDLAIYNYKNLTPSQYNVRQQLRIIKDVADGLNYLHSISKFKKSQIVHGNLSADHVLLELNSDGEYTAKIFDFTAAVDSEETSAEVFDSMLKNEMYRFGLIIFNVISWRSMDQNECDSIHIPYANKNDLDIHKYQVYCQYKLDRQENDHVLSGLFRLFYRLTSPDYDASKGVNNRIIILIDNMIAGNA